MFSALTTAAMMKSVVPISRFNKGEAGKIIEEVKADGIKIIVKNNIPECVMLPVKTYDELVEKADSPKQIVQSEEEVAKRKAFIEKIRKNVTPPKPATISLKEAIETYGPIDVDEEAVNKLREISYPRGEM